MRRSVLAAGAGVAAAGLAWAAWVEPRRFHLHRGVIRLAGWPPALDGLRVAVLSDLHAGGPNVDAARLREIAATVERHHPDLVVLLGDFVDYRVLFAPGEEPEAVAAALAELRAPLGRVAVLGNHDWVNVGERMRTALTETGTRVLEDEAVRLGHGLWVAGVGDERERGADVHRALESVPEDAPVILLSHDPDVFPRVPARVALTLAGHLHGGQVALPLLQRLMLPSRFGTRYLRGLVEEDGRLLFVTSGVGESGLPIRFARPPEGWVLELRAR